MERRIVNQKVNKKILVKIKVKVIQIRKEEIKVAIMIKRIIHI